MTSLKQSNMKYKFSTRLYRKRYWFAAIAVPVILLIIILPQIYPPATPVISFGDGSVQGRIGVSRNGAQYWEFLSIPYAQPPTGKLRYSPPVKVRPWTGIKQTTRYPPFCAQFDAIVTQTVYGEEDCLYLNVFTHPVRNATKVPVLVYIHGGGFLMGGSRMYGPDYFMDHDIVVVTFNYRLGPLGFFNFNERGLPLGNMGMKDQVMVLQWIQTNIEYFGGDPKRVTIFGDSAGGISVNLHVLSPKSQGLFHRAISQSGSANSPWGFTEKPRETAYEYAKRLKCPIGKTTTLMECLENYDPMELVKHQLACTDPFLEKDNLSPSLERIRNDDTFLEQERSVLLKRGDFQKVPYLFGVNSGEGALRTARFDALPTSVKTLQTNWTELVGRALLLDDLPITSAIAIKDFFFASNTSYENPQIFKDTLTQIFSDVFAFLPVTKSAEEHALQGGSTYLYYYNYTPVLLPGVYSMLKACTPNDWLRCEFHMLWSVMSDWFQEHVFGLGGSHQYGVCHGEEAFILWNVNGMSKYFSWMETKFSEDFIKVIVSFVQGDSTLIYKNVPWTPITTNETLMMTIDGSTAPHLIRPPYSERLRFWEDLKKG